MGNAQAAEEKAKAVCVGYRVLGVQPNSPAHKSGLVSFFDFIVAANGVPLKTLDSTFIDLIKANENIPLPLTIYNYKNQTVRDVSVTPSRTWGGTGLLGVTIRFDSYFNATENLVRVLKVSPGGPAELAGLTPEVDYLLGTAERVFKNPDVLGDELQTHIEQPMELYVYNAESDAVRIVVLLPSLSWGGQGVLGAEVGHGFLHTLPKNCRDSIGTSSGMGISSPPNVCAVNYDSVNTPPSDPAAVDLPRNESYGATTDKNGGDGLSFIAQPGATIDVNLEATEVPQD